MAIRTQTRDACAIVQIDYPERRNALSPDLMRTLIATVNEAALGPGIAGVVITGAGTAFSAGGDVKHMARRLSSSEPDKGIDPVYREFFTALLDVPVPTVAAVDGVAVGLGLDIALACDSRVFGPNGWFKYGWSDLGILPGSGGIVLLGARAPGKLWTVLEAGTRYDGAAAERLGIADFTPDAPALERCVERVNRYAAIPRRTLEAYVLLDRADLKRRLSEHYDELYRIQKPLLAGREFKGSLEQHRSLRGLAQATEEPAP